MPFRQAEFYVRQNPEDDHFLTIEDLRDMVGHEGENFPTMYSTIQPVQGYTSILDATKKHIDCNGRHSWNVYHFFTHSVADLQWPELACLFATEYDGSYSQATAPIENPALAHCFFIIGYNNLSKHFMWTFLEQQIIGCGMNGSIGEVRIFMVLHG